MEHPDFLTKVIRVLTFARDKFEGGNPQTEEKAIIEAAWQLYDEPRYSDLTDTAIEYALGCRTWDEAISLCRNLQYRRLCKAGSIPQISLEFLSEAIAA